MKVRHLLLLFIPLLLSSCFEWGNDTDVRESNYTPVVMTRNNFENDVYLQPQPRPVIRSGKIYIAGSILFVNEVNKGFHVYDYSNPASPVAVAFINIPGATDVAMRDNFVYINQATDLVTFRLTTINTLVLVKRDRNVFPQKQSPDGFLHNVPENNIVVDWVN